MHAVLDFLNGLVLIAVYAIAYDDGAHHNSPSGGVLGPRYAPLSNVVHAESRFAQRSNNGGQ